MATTRALRPHFGRRRHVELRGPSTERVMTRRAVDEVNQRIYSNVMRHLEGKNRAEVCRKAGIKENTLSLQLAKKRFTLELLAPLAKAFDTTIGDLTDPPKKERVPLQKAPELVKALEELLDRAKR